MYTIFKNNVFKRLISSILFFLILLLFSCNKGNDAWIGTYTGDIVLENGDKYTYSISLLHDKAIVIKSPEKADSWEDLGKKFAMCQDVPIKVETIFDDLYWKITIGDDSNDCCLLPFDNCYNNRLVFENNFTPSTFEEEVLDFDATITFGDQDWPVVFLTKKNKSTSNQK